MKTIRLTQGKVAIVDDEDYERLVVFRWYYTNGYAARSTNPGRVWLHHEILSPKDNLQIDHINGDSLDNRRTNLRLVDQSSNRQNSSKSGRPFGFRGVHLDTKSGKFHAKICKKRVITYLGSFNDPIEAARAYDLKAVELYGKEAYLNFPEAREALHTFILEERAFAIYKQRVA